MKGRRAAQAWAFSLVGLVPHIVEDFAYRVPERFGLDPVAAGWLVGAVFAVQALAALGSAGGSRRAVLVLAVVAGGWVIAAGADHWRAFLPADFRGGMSSRAWVWSLILGQGLTLLFAVRALLSGADSRPG